MHNDSLVSRLNLADRDVLVERDLPLFEQCADSQAQVTSLCQLVVGTSAQNFFQGMPADCPVHLCVRQLSQIL
ncbi:hypothetical protein D3C76_1458510 [compost metagenome]